MQPTPVFLPGEFLGQRGLTGYSPWDHKELDMTERLTLRVLLQFLSFFQIQSTLAHHNYLKE